MRPHCVLSFVQVYVAQGHRAWGILEGLQRYGFKV